MRLAHAHSCALGTAAGCTNRAARIRNLPDDLDPLWALSDADRISCLARTFRLACDNDDPWGCLMAGQSAALGEGSSPDLAQAQKDFERTCDLAPDKEAMPCMGARQAIVMIGGQ
jgi:hypothetical protein